jgi:isoleucyl-tRNA synthetase
MDGFNPETDSIEDLLEIDRWALASLSEMAKKVVRGYETYDFQVVYSALYNFCTVTLSAQYFDIIKDRLYTSAPKSHARRSAQTALYKICQDLSLLLAPILAFTADEAWENLPNQTVESVHLAEFPSVSEAVDSELLANWERIFSIRTEVLRKLEEARIEKLIGSSLEAKVKLTVDEETFDFLTPYRFDLRYIFIVSQVELFKGDAFGVEIAKAEGLKCDRCWNYSHEVGKDERYPTACERCLEALIEIEKML